jgi:DNA-binding HxlR family transcriptional regulator
MWKFASKTYPCPISLTAGLLSSKWRTNVLWLIWSGTNRFNFISRELPQVNQGALIRFLRELESDGLVVRKEYGRRPAPVEYSLTEWGRAHGESVEEDSRP